MSMKEGLPASRHPRRLFVPVVSSAIALLALACSTGVGQNSTQRNYPDISPGLSAFFDNLEKEKQVSSPKNAQLSPSVWQQPTSKTVKINYSGRENYSATGTSERFTPDFRRKLDINAEVTLQQKTCRVVITFKESEQVESVRNTNEVTIEEVPVFTSAKRIEIPKCEPNQVSSVMKAALSLTP